MPGVAQLFEDSSAGQSCDSERSLCCRVETPLGGSWDGLGNAQGKMLLLLTLGVLDRGGSSGEEKTVAGFGRWNQQILMSKSANQLSVGLKAKV